MILLVGIPSEGPLALLQDALSEASLDFILLNQRLFSDADLHADWIDGAWVGWLSVGGRRWSLDSFSGVYQRMVGENMLPELLDEEPDSPARRHFRALMSALREWLEVVDANVLNRPSHQAFALSKVAQLRDIIDVGFEVPETLVTDDPQLVRDFCLQHNRVIYKSVSSARSVVRLLDERGTARLSDIQWCPTQFQEWVDGSDVRVHTVGGEVFGALVESAAVDYRFANQESRGSTALHKWRVPDDIAERCLRLSRRLGLEVAGIDLRIASSGRVYCFEVNPSPVFPWYERATGQQISASVARHLADGWRSAR